LNISFLLLSFNSSKHILQCLESIKHNVNISKADNQFELVVADDGSSDNTLYLINNWISANKNIFIGITIRNLKHNIGIVRNYINGLDACEGDIIKPIAGDDILPGINIFNYFNSNNYDVCFGLRIPFEGGVIKYTYADYFKNQVYNKSAKHFRFRPTFFTHAASVYKKNVIGTELKKILMNYKYLEDIPLIYYLIKQYKYQYINLPFILYRIHSESVSKNTKSLIFRESLVDYINFYKYTQKDTYNFFEKMFFKYKYEDYKRKIASSNSKLFSFYRYLDLFTYWIWYSKKYNKVFNSKKFENEFIEISNILSDNEKCIKYFSNN
jgi:alpha-1,3-rhamnosyltransferase